MSGLAALLAGRKPVGLYHWHGAFDVPTVQHTVEHAGWRFAHLDGWTKQTKSEFLAGIGEALALPGEYAGNFDSLADCLLDVRAGDSAGVVLLWDGWAPFARADEQGFSVALSVLGSRVNDSKGGAFAVLLRGEGPDVRLPSLD